MQCIASNKAQQWEGEAGSIELEPTHLVVRPRFKSELRIPLRGIKGILVYRDARLGFYMQNEDVVDVPVPLPFKWDVAGAVSRGCAF